MSSDTYFYELRRHPVLRGVAQRSGPGARADRQESERAPRGRGPDQGRIQMQGNAYLQESFENLDYIRGARVVTD